MPRMKGGHPRTHRHSSSANKIRGRKRFLQFIASIAESDDWEYPGGDKMQIDAGYFLAHYRELDRWFNERLDNNIV